MSEFPQETNARDTIEKKDLPERVQIDITKLNPGDIIGFHTGLETGPQSEYIVKIIDPSPEKKTVRVSGGYFTEPKIVTLEGATTGGTFVMSGVIEEGYRVDFRDPSIDATEIGSKVVTSPVQKIFRMPTA